MRPELSAVLISAGTTAAVASAGAAALWRLSSGRPAVAARSAPAVVVIALAAGVAVATRTMVIAENDHRTVLFVLAAGAPMAALIGFLLARRVSAMEQQAARDRADRLRIEQVEAGRRETLGWLSHDLRTPLAGIRALAESLQEQVIDDPRSAGEQIVRAADRLNGMVDDIAELSRMHGGVPRAREPVPLDDLVSDAVELVAPVAETRGIRVEADALCGEVLTVDVVAVTRAVTNLLRNAIDHTPPGGRVGIGTRRAQDAVEIMVDDACGGIPVAELARVFEPGWRGDAARSGGAPSEPGGGGMGLGLAIVAVVARAHGGLPTVRNRDDGSGCTFTLALRGGLTG